MNIEQLKQKRESLKAQLAQVESELDQLTSAEKAAIVDGIRKTMADYGISIEVIAKAMKQRLAKGKKAALPPKYHNPKTGETWSGRGRTPLWLAGARNRDRFLIATDA